MIEFIKKNYSKLGIGLALTMLVINYYQQRELAELRIKAAVASESVAPLAGDIKITRTIDSLQNVIDSVRDEIMPLEVELGRYEMTLELLKEEDKKAANKFELILTTQTE
jgi:hypothetical protein